MPENRPINSDELGAKGQFRFQELCTDAKLIPNEAGRDRTGWDFIVEFPLADPKALEPLDSRPGPPWCRVQVKTTWFDNHKVEAPLGSMERLAKDASPAFIYVLKYNHDLVPTEAYLIHLLDQNLAKLLKRLRRESLNDTARLNDCDISFRPARAGIVLPPTGAALRDALEGACGTDLSAYMRKKSEQLENLGFDADWRYRFTVRFTADGPRGLVDTLLGLRTAEAQISREVEKRFGIELPVRRIGTASGIMRFDPEGHDCQVAFRSDSGGRPATFSARVSGVMFEDLPEEHRAIRVTTDVFTLIFRSGEVTLQPNEPEPSLPPKTWMQYHRMHQFLAGPRTTIELIHPTLKSQSFVVRGPSTMPDVKFHTYMEETCRLLDELCGLCGADLKPLTSGAILKSSGHIRHCLCLLGELTPGTVAFTTNLESTRELLPSSRLNLVISFHIGDGIIGYYVTVDAEGKAEGDEITWTSTAISAGEALQIGPTSEAFDEFVERCKLRTGVSHCVAYTFDHPAPAG